jgi:hypothetical protein
MGPSFPDSLCPILSVLDVGIEHAVLCAASVPPQAAPFVFGQPAAPATPGPYTMHQVRPLLSPRRQNPTFQGTRRRVSEADVCVAWCMTGLPDGDR